MTLALVDAHAELHRAHHSRMTELTGPAGEPTKALFLFLRLIRRLVEEDRQHVVVCWDEAKQNLIRRRWYPAYKADRKTRSPDEGEDALGLQMAHARRILQRLGVSQVRAAGWEADDVIATLVCRYQQQPVRIIARDKDLHQCLIYPRAVVVNSSTGETLDAPAACQHWGVDRIGQVLEVQTLAGDTTDNVPGVRGIGIKTATSLIKRFGTARAVIDQRHLLSKAQARALGEFDYDLGRKLVALQTDLRVLSWKLQPSAKWRPLDMAAAKDDLRRLGIRHLDA